MNFDNRIVKKIQVALRKYIFIPLNVSITISVFMVRRALFGFGNANQMLQRMSKPSIIPILKKYDAAIGSNCDLETGLIFHNCHNYKNLIIGDNCHIGKNCFFDLREKIIIENNTVISMQTTFITHHDISKSRLSKVYPSKSKPVLIKENSYIGANSIILMGVTLFEASFIAAGSVVIKDVPPLTMVGGVPAKEIKKLELNIESKV